MTSFLGAIGDNVTPWAVPSSARKPEGRKRKSIGVAGNSLLFHQVETVPVSAEVPDLSRGQLESSPEFPVLEEDVRVPEARRVEVLALTLLCKDPLHALDQSDLFQDSNLAVAGCN